MTTTTTSTLLPIATSSYPHAPNPRVLLPFFLLGFMSTTINMATITYLAYTKNDTPMLLFATFIYVVYFSFDFSSTPPLFPNARGTNRVKLTLWVLLSGTMLGFACKFATFLTLPESLCFFWVVIGGSALLLSAWIGEDDKNKSVNVKEQYADLVQSFAPIMLMFFGLSRRYLTTQLILHAAIMNLRTLVAPTRFSVNTTM